MPTSPEAGSVVEQVKRALNQQRTAGGEPTIIMRDSTARALLAVVEAAKLAWDHGTNENLDDLGDKLDALYTPDSVEER